MLIGMQPSLYRLELGLEGGDHPTREGLILDRQCAVSVPTQPWGGPGASKENPSAEGFAEDRVQQSSPCGDST